MASYIRVSEILARLRDYTGIDPVMLENKARIGTNVHNAILQDTVGDFPMLTSEREAAYFQSYLIFKKTERPQFKMQVPRLYDNDLMITGEIDGLVDKGGLYPYLIDWKCSYSVDEEIWNMQAHFYWYLLKRNNIDVAQEMVWVNLRHRKWLEEREHLRLDDYGNHYMQGEYIERYAPLAPKVCRFQFDENILSRCIDEANKAWEEKKESFVVDI